MKTLRLTAAQALVRFLGEQYVHRDGKESKFFGGCFGIFGHGNVAGIGEALYEFPESMRYYQARSEQGMVHAAVGYARMNNRIGALACTTSVGPGATNMITGAALATINRLPVLLLPGDVFASRRSEPVLQQLEVPWSGDLSVNDCFRPVSRFFDRISRPEQVVEAGLAAMRVLTDQAETGAVTLAFPQDVQAEAYDFPATFFRPRVWPIYRSLPPREALREAAAAIRRSRRPLVVAGGGVIYSEASIALRQFVEVTGIPVAETQAGKGALPWDHSWALGAIGVTGSLAANSIAADADLVIGIGTRWSDFTTASRTAFRHPSVQFININVAALDAMKHAGLSLVGDARSTVEALTELLSDWSVADEHRDAAEALRSIWDEERERLVSPSERSLLTQREVIGALNDFAEDGDVVVAAAGSMPGELHKLWRSRDPKAYHVEYGYSCMGYEIAGALGAKLAAPDRNVYVLVGDGSYLMLSSELVTAVQEGLKLTVVLVDNQGFNSIGALSRLLGTDGFGTQYRRRRNGSLGLDSEREGGELLPVDLGANAASLGAHLLRAQTLKEFRRRLGEAAGITQPVVIHVPVDRYEGVPAYESWWDVPVSEVSSVAAVAAARERYDASRSAQQVYL